ncbi:Rpn family recombination-promoting nuclease/putative transposase [Leptospira sp. P2653]|uniref:Rpn family recombination-promoting nuclease/putative transposase n=1 Tax=Leptospira sp. P2653 TaxID=1218600 RepID=UPI000561DEC0|nr:Rpn family recombination-promoting nuclease/putative transposase [Leptospira sp. P2653]
MFKTLFVKEPKLLISMLNSVIFATQEHWIRELTILNPELTGELPKDKRSYLDIRAKDETGRIFHVEIQVAHENSFVKRSLYYLSGLIRDQLKSGEGYSDLKAVYQVNIVDFNLIPSENYHSKFKFREESNPEITLTDELEIHYIELPKLTEEDHLRLLREGSDLYRWMYLFKHTRELTEEEMSILVDKTPDLSKAFTILEQYSNDPKKRKEIEEKLKSDRDYVYDLAARFEAGERQGIEKGIEKGEFKKALEAARKMLRKGIDLKTTLEVTGLTEKDLRDHGIR